MHCRAAHRVIVFWPHRAGARGTHWEGAVVGTGLVAGGVEHVHHGHTEVHPQGVNHKEAEAGEQRQAVARGATCWSYKGKSIGVISVCLNAVIINGFSFPLGEKKSTDSERWSSSNLQQSRRNIHRVATTAGANDRWPLILLTFTPKQTMWLCSLVPAYVLETIKLQCVLPCRSSHQTTIFAVVHRTSHTTKPSETHKSDADTEQSRYTGYMDWP